MSDNEDRDLQALQRQLEDAFETTRPRAGFEDDLWSRMQARRPLWAQVRDFFAGLIESVRRVPVAPAATVAVVLVLAIGIGIISFGGFRGGGAGGATSATSRDSQTAPFAGGAGAPGAFGRLPGLALQPVPGAETAPKTAGPTGPLAGQSAVGLYFGPANLVWAGHFNFQVTSAPVYRYAEPTIATADQFAATLGATRQTGLEGLAPLGEYAGSGFVLGIAGTSQSPLREPFFFLTPDRSKLAAPAPTAIDTANAFLAAHNLVPAWPYVVATVQSGDVVRVLYLRQFAVQGVGEAYMVDGVGERHGLEVDLRGGQPLQVGGPLPVSLDTADYPMISAGMAVQSALKSSPAGPASIEPIPTVRLNTVELIYALAVGGDHSFYEPAFLFSGTFIHNGVTYVKRVLVPAVDPSQRSS
jgi:hypothetical protein